MEKRNTILLAVIAIATLLIAVVGATFAYFASNINTNANIGVNVSTSNNQAVFLANSDGELALNIASYMMQEHDATNNAEGGVTTNEANITPSLTDNANIEVTLNANGTGGLVKCTYDVLYAWDASSSAFENYTEASSKSNDKFHPSKYYVRSEYKKGEADGEDSFTPTENFREITLGGTMTVTPSGTESTTSGNIFNEGEKNIDQLECVTANGAGTEDKKCEILYLRKGETISTEEEAKVDYNFTIKFYNLPSDQSSLMGKNLKGKIYIDNVKC